MAGKLFKTAQKINDYATPLNEEALTKITGFIDTGFYGLNSIISADLYGGIPKGRVTTFFGPSQSGKSLVSSLLQKNAQKDGMDVIIFDTEFDKDGRMEGSFGVDLSKVMSLPIESIEELIIQATKMLDDVVNDESEHGKYLFILDSLGFLSSEKELKDAADKSKVAMDMGLRAKLIKNFFRNIKGKVAKSKCAFLIINHEIANPNQLYDSVFKEQGGGKSTEFVSTVMVHISATKQKQDEKNTLDVESMFTNKKYTGQRINFFTQKNRCAIPHKKIECYLNFVSGIDQYSGLDGFFEYITDVLYLKDAQGNTGKGLTYYMKEGDKEIKLGKFKEWKNNKDIWDKLLPHINEIVKSELAYKEH